MRPEHREAARRDARVRPMSCRDDAEHLPVIRTRLSNGNAGKRREGPLEGLCSCFIPVHGNPFAWQTAWASPANAAATTVRRGRAYRARARPQDAIARTSSGAAC